ncbi:DUF4174 domain-containing protein [bacterium]|nr:DUF4174 domain-containing protein [bacterium]
MLLKQFFQLFLLGLNNSIYFSFLTILSIPLISNASNITQLYTKVLDLKKNRWRHRVIIVENDNTQQQQNLFINCYDAFTERKIKIFLKPQTSNNNNQFFKVSLIGLDGEVKKQSARPQSCKYFIDAIDQMPMRIKEMK